MTSPESPSANNDNNTRFFRLVETLNQPTIQVQETLLETVVEMQYVEWEQFGIVDHLSDRFTGLIAYSLNLQEYAVDLNGVGPTKYCAEFVLQQATNDPGVNVSRTEIVYVRSLLKNRMPKNEFSTDQADVAYKHICQRRDLLSEGALPDISPNLLSINGLSQQ